MRNDLEHEVQCAIHHYLTLKRIMHWAIPNGGYRSRSEGGRFKAEGVLAGVADMMLLLPGMPVFVEVKTSKGRQSVSQVCFQKAVEVLGYRYLIWRSVDDAVSWVRANV